MMKGASVSNLLFRAVCIFFSVVLMVMTLLSHAKLMETESICTELEDQIAISEKEKEILQVQIENRISLYELEKIAVNQLGMHRPSTDQLYFGMIPG